MNQSSDNPIRPLRPQQRPVERRVFDVMRPGRAPASATSKPVIVNTTPGVQDPLVTMNGVGEPRRMLDAKKKIEIKPSDAAAQATPEPALIAVPDIKSSSSIPEAAPTQPLEAPEPSTIPQEIRSSIPEQPAPSDATLPPSPIEPAVTDDDMLDNMPAPIVDEHHVSVSHQIGPRTFPWKLVIMIVIVVLLAVVVLDVLLDADFISWKIPHTRFLQ